MIADDLEVGQCFRLLDSRCGTVYRKTAVGSPWSDDACECVEEVTGFPCMTSLVSSVWPVARPGVPVVAPQAPLGVQLGLFGDDAPEGTPPRVARRRGLGRT
jgi:hypothetical protein